MLRALFTGITGLSAHQQMLDVTANNIANVNTTGFKASRTVFQDTLSQTLRGAAGGVVGATGGTNAQQIGLGVKLAGTELDMTQGSNQSTGVGTDLMINGDGYFVVQKGGQELYTRAGAFHLDEVGQLVTPDGALVKGFAPGQLAADGSVTPGAVPTELNLAALLDGTYLSYSIDQQGRINAIDATGSPTTIGVIAMATFANPNGLQKIGDSQYAASASSGAADVGGPDAGPRGSVSAGYLEMSNVDLAAQLTNLIISERGFQANSKSVTTADQILQTLVNLK